MEVDTDTKYLYVMGLTRRKIPPKSFSNIDEEYYDYYQSRVIRCLKKVQEKTSTSSIPSLRELHPDGVLTILADPLVERDMTFFYFAPHHFSLSAEKLLSILEPLTEKEKKDAQRQLLEVMANHQRTISTVDFDNWVRMWRLVDGNETMIEKVKQSKSLSTMMEESKKAKEEKRFEEHQKRYAEQTAKVSKREFLPPPSYKMQPPKSILGKTPAKHVQIPTKHMQSSAKHVQPHVKHVFIKQPAPAKYVETKKYVRFYL